MQIGQDYYYYYYYYLYYYYYYYYQHYYYLYYLYHHHHHHHRRHRLMSQTFLPGTSLEPAVIPTAQASSFTLQYFPYYV